MQTVRYSSFKKKLKDIRPFTLICLCSRWWRERISDT